MRVYFSGALDLTPEAASSPISAWHKILGDHVVQCRELSMIMGTRGGVTVTLAGRRRFAAVPCAAQLLTAKMVQPTADRIKLDQLTKDYA